ncbi:hypothetical protein IGI04_015366 [Brassica rapa subsp. trilocularis]|uniref:Uncharacterized protein n=1 Tax=Brassica rapa subsp. trilocularis TaxID=1813537 RepID=A0ABQ7MPU9_BRACM|nr:hypothetical protein IGI04_015366 [Brassica rapa subsp. trilocularis]
MQSALWFPSPCGETARPKVRRWRRESAFRTEDPTGSGFLFFSSPVNLHGISAWFRILYPGSRGQHAPSFTMTELSPGVVGLVGDAWRSSAFEHRQMGRDSLRWSTSAFLQAAIWYTGRVSCCQGPSFSPVLVTGFLAVNPTAGGPKLSLICALVWILLVTG